MSASTVPRIGDAVRQAAAEHLEAKGPLAECFEALGAFGDALVGQMQASVEGAALAVDRRLEALESAREGAEAAAEEARLAVADHKAQADRALVDLVDGLKTEIGAGIKDVLIIKQRVVGAQRIGLVAGLGAAAAVVVFLAGAGTMAWRDARAVQFHAACVQEIVRDAHGNAYCPLRGMPAEEGGGS